jgi:serine protease Do
MVIQSVRTGSFADMQGLDAGLVITRINRQPTGNRAQYTAIVNQIKPGDDVVFELINPHQPAQGLIILGGKLQ